MPVIRLNPSLSTNFHLEGYEVTIDNINLNASDFENRDDGDQNWRRLKIVPITIKINENLNISGDVYTENDELGFTLYEVGNFSMKYNLNIKHSKYGISSLVPTCKQLNGMVNSQKAGKDSSDLIKSHSNKNVKTSYSTCIISLQKPNTDGILWIKGKITFKIVLTNEILKDLETDSFKIDMAELLKWDCFISKEANQNLKSKENFIIKCKGKNFYFNKTLLCIISDVFSAMIQGKLGQEGQSGIVEINDFTPDIIRAFKRICFESKDFEEEDSIPDLLLFAQKYFMNPLKQKCLNYLVTNLNQSNIYDVIKIADQIDDENLLKICVNYMCLNKSKLKKNEEWQDFQKSHPECMIRIMNLMLYSDSK